MPPAHPHRVKANLRVNRPRGQNAVKTNPHKNSGLGRLTPHNGKPPAVCRPIATPQAKNRLASAYRLATPLSSSDFSRLSLFGKTHRAPRPKSGNRFKATRAFFYFHCNIIIPLSLQGVECFFFCLFCDTSIDNGVKDQTKER